VNILPRETKQNYVIVLTKGEIYRKFFFQKSSAAIGNSNATPHVLKLYGTIKRSDMQKETEFPLADFSEDWCY